MRRLLPVLAIALVVGACSRCGKPLGGGPPTAELARQLPKAAEAVLIVPDLRVIGDKAAILQQLKLATFLAQVQGFATAEDYVSAVMAQVGVDLRKPDELKKAGIDPGRGLGVALLAGERAYSVVGVSDADKLRETLTRLARDRLGASAVDTQVHEGVRLTTFARSAGSPPALGLLVKDRFAFIAAGASVQHLSEWAALPASGSLAEDAAYNASARRLPGDRDLLVHVPSGATASTRFLLAGSSVAVRLTREALVLTSDTPWPDTQRSLDVVTPKDGPELMGLLPQDAFLVARFSGDPLLLEPYLPMLFGRHVDRAVQETGFDFKGEILSNLKPGQVLAISVAPSAKLGGDLPSFDVRHTNPFRYLHLTAAAEAKDATKAAQTLERIPPFAQRFAAHVEPAERGGQKVYLTTYSQGEGAHLALKGNDLIMAAPEQRLLEALARVGQKSEGPGLMADAALKKVFSKGGLVAVLDLPRLTDSVKALPSEAWGVGGFAIKATTVRWLEAINDLRAITLVVSSQERAVQAELALRMTPK